MILPLPRLVGTASRDLTGATWSGANTSDLRSTSQAHAAGTGLCSVSIQARNGAISIVETGSEVVSGHTLALLLQLIMSISQLVQQLRRTSLSVLRCSHSANQCVDEPTLGAIQNRFESVISSLQVASENAEASRSRIQDADFASETANLTKSQILTQAGISVLAQANAQPQQVLALLQ